MFEQNFEPIEAFLPLLDRKQVEIWVVFTEKPFSHAVVSCKAIVSEKLLFSRITIVFPFKIHLEWYNSDEIWPRTDAFSAGVTNLKGQTPVQIKVVLKSR